MESSFLQNRLPEGWEELTDPNSGKHYFINHKTRTSSWVDPRLEAWDWTKGMPRGWAIMHDEGVGAYYVDHNEKRTYLPEDPALPKALADSFAKDRQQLFEKMSPQKTLKSNAGFETSNMEDAFYSAFSATKEKISELKKEINMLSQQEALEQQHPNKEWSPVKDHLVIEMNPSESPERQHFQPPKRDHIIKGIAGHDSGFLDLNSAHLKEALQNSDASPELKSELEVYLEFKNQTLMSTSEEERPKVNVALQRIENELLTAI